MREIKYTNRFKRDYKREKVGQHGKKFDLVLMEAVKILAVDAATALVLRCEAKLGARKMRK